jgi:lipopolysaccharide transport system permease protein
MSATTCMQKNVNLITRVNFPKITIPLSAIVASLADFLISFAMLIILMCYYKVDFNITMLLCVPIFFIQLIFTIGVVLIIVTLTMYIKDFEQAASFVIRLGMLISPVGYSLQMIPERVIKLYLLNPMAGLLDSYRKVLLHQSLPNLEYLGIGFFVSLIVLFFGFWFFKKGEPAFVDIF